MSDELEEKDRASYYRKLADQAERDAAKATAHDIRQGFLKVAAGWRALADSAERRG